MNRNRHRVVMSAARGQLMAVSECVRTMGKASSCTVTTAAASLLFCLPSQAQISADPTAAGNLRPTVLTAPNAVPLVNIQTPSAAGVSRNVYQQFDVNAQGAILNNSRTNVQTQLGGWVQGNPWLATGPARVILNEVNSSQPSRLNGWLEVGGQRAEVIVANPAGINVNGGGFINASRATLTTGTPLMNAGALEGFRVRGGQVRVEGLGLDASTTDHAAILARAVEVNAGLWAKALTVVTGVNDVTANSAGITPLAPESGVGSAPAFALDVAAIGGMYAGQIHLIGTEAGLGVRNAGGLGASAGTLVLEANGWLHNSGSLVAAQTLDIHSAGITQHGLIDAQTTRITTGELANEGAGRIYGDSIAINAENLTNDTGAVIAARHTLNATSGTLINREGALLLSGGDMTLAATDRLENRSASIEALGNLSITAPVLVNANDHMSHTVVSDATTNRTVYFTPAGEVDASEVAWSVVKPFDGTSWDLYDLQERESLLLRTSAWADPAFRTYYLGALPFVAAHLLSWDIGESSQTQFVGDTFTYSRHSPIWAHFGMPAPTWDAPGQMPRATDNGDGVVQPPDPQALATWQAQAAPWVELTARVSSFKSTVEGQFLRFDAYSSYAQTTQRAVMTRSEPARISSGGAMTLGASHSLLNQDSEIVAGGALSMTGVQVTNHATEVNAPTSRSGTLNSWGVTGSDCDLFGCDPEYGWIQTPYAETIANNVKLPALRYESASSAVPSSGTSTPLSPTLGNALFNLSPDPEARAVFETDPRFASYRQWLNSDHLLSALAVDPATVQKRLGDGFIEQRLVREQVSALTGQRFLGDFSSDEAQFLALMDAGATFARAHQLRPGITLSADQVAALKRSGLLGSSSTETRTHNSRTDAVGSALGGRQVVIHGGQDISLTGSSAVADDTIDITAGRDVAITAALTHSAHSNFVEKKRSGLLASGGGITLGKQQQSTEQQTRSTGAAASTVGAIGGDVNITAGRTYTQTGSDVMAPGGDIEVNGQNIQITEARTSERSTSEQKFKQSGLSMGLGGGVIAAAQGVTQTLNAIGETGDSRMKILGAASVALQTSSAIGSVQDALAKGASPTKAAGVSINLSLGTSKSHSISQSTSEGAHNSAVRAAGDVNLSARGGGQDSNILIRGSEVSAGTNATLSAEGDVALLAAQNTTSLSGSNKSSSGSIGVSFGTSDGVAPGLKGPLALPPMRREPQHYPHQRGVTAGHEQLRQPAKGLQRQPGRCAKAIPGRRSSPHRMPSSFKHSVANAKRGDGASIKSLMGPRTVSCADQSAQAWPQSRWAEGNYLPVKQEMDALLVACENKVVAALDELLRD